MTPEVHYGTQDFLALFQDGASKFFQGTFHLSSTDETMDLDLHGCIFKGCNITGGDLASSSFAHCLFEDTTFFEVALVGVTFRECRFVRCAFVNVQQDLSMEKCAIDKLTFTQMHGKRAAYHYRE